MNLFTSMARFLSNSIRILEATKQGVNRAEYKIIRIFCSWRDTLTFNLLKIIIYSTLIYYLRIGWQSKLIIHKIRVKAIPTNRHFKWIETKSFPCMKILSQNC